MTSDLFTSQTGLHPDHAPTGPALIAPPPVLRVRSFAFLAVALTMIGLMVVLQLIDTKLEPAGIVGLELAGQPDRASTILSEWHGAGATHHALWSVALDFPVIAAYSLVLASLASAAGRWGWSRLPHFARLGLAIAWGQYIAGMADLGENLALLAMLGGGAPSPFPEIARSLATGKRKTCQARHVMFRHPRAGQPPVQVIQPEFTSLRVSRKVLRAHANSSRSRILLASMEPSPTRRSSPLRCQAQRP